VGDEDSVDRGTQEEHAFEVISHGHVIEPGAVDVVPGRRAQGTVPQPFLCLGEPPSQGQ
jgi:hypothetical protein